MGQAQEILGQEQERLGQGQERLGQGQDRLGQEEDNYTRITGIRTGQNWLYKSPWAQSERNCPAVDKVISSSVHSPHLVKPFYVINIMLQHDMNDMNKAKK